MGDLRQIEARRAVGSLGITNVWFLGGHDTPSQNVLNSLERCTHGHCLDELVRIIRITQPAVILTWLPDFTTGENHADHQASGVLATEAFDLAGNPTVFSEQVSPATNPDKAGNLTEGLRPWQPEKIYYFCNSTHDIFAGQGPVYSSQEISPSQHLSYGRLAAGVFANHLTQGGSKVATEIASNTLGTSSVIGKLANGDVKLIFGKSLVPSNPTNDVFSGIVPSGIPYHPAAGYIAVGQEEPVLEIGDPWSYYHKFWQAHDLVRLATIVPAEISVHVSGTLMIPLVVDNPLDTPIDATFSVNAPEGWTVAPIAAATIAPHSLFYLRVQAIAPAEKLSGWQQFTVSGESNHKSIGTVQLRAELSTGWVAPQ
jgi:hypothetical protein